MQVNSNVTINSFEMGGLPQDQKTLPLPINGTSSPKPSPEIDYKNMLGTPLASTVVNIGLSSPGTNSSLIPQNNTVYGSQETQKNFLDNFSKMLEGFLSSMTKMFDSFMNRMTELTGKLSSNTAPASSSSGSTTPTTSTTSSSSSTPSSTRVPQSWQTKAASYLKGDENGMISESDLQEAIVKYQFHQKSDQAESVFISELEKAKAQTTNRQNAIKLALKNTVSSGAVTQAEGDYVYSISFKAAQFDTNVDKISTAQSTGGLSAANAIQLGAVSLTTIREGTNPFQSRSINTME